jgi:hypothetical protein
MKKTILLIVVALAAVGYVSEKGYQDYKLSKLIGGGNCEEIGEGGTSCSQANTSNIAAGSPCDVSSTPFKTCAEGKGQAAVYSETSQLKNVTKKEDDCKKGDYFYCNNNSGNPARPDYRWANLVGTEDCGKQSKVTASKEPADPKCAPKPKQE